jgi:hypothetical protein
MRVQSPSEGRIVVTIIRTVLAGLVLAALTPLAPSTADAQTATCRPWCVIYGGGGGRGGGTNCGFTSYEQCMWTAQGSDMCMPNGFCPPKSSARGGRPGYDDWSRRR